MPALVDADDFGFFSFLLKIEDEDDDDDDEDEDEDEDEEVGEEVKQTSFKFVYSETDGLIGEFGADEVRSMNSISGDGFALFALGNERLLDLSSKYVSRG